ncbi:hypothetical protein AgCh_033299 [Apium graveolens]
MRPTKGNDSLSSSPEHENCMFIAHKNAALSTPGGCMYEVNSSRFPPPKVKGIQVFTYKDLEVATEKFSETNVIGNGGFGVVYKGILSDGKMAAVKMLHGEWKRGERAFRKERISRASRGLLIHQILTSGAKVTAKRRKFRIPTTEAWHAHTGKQGGRAETTEARCARAGMRGGRARRTEIERACAVIARGRASKMNKKDVGVKIPFLDKDNYHHWKVKMHIHLLSQDEAYVDCIERGPHVPMRAATGNEPSVPKPRHEWSDPDIEQVMKDKKAMNILFNGVDGDMFDNIINCKIS